MIFDSNRAMLRKITALMKEDAYYRRYKRSDVRSLIAPAISLNQFAIMKVNGSRIGFVTWARVNQKIHDRLWHEDFQLSVPDWSSGENVWIMDAMMLQGHPVQLVRFLQRYFEDYHQVNYIRRTSLGALRKRVQFTRSNSRHSISIITKERRDEPMQKI